MFFEQVFFSSGFYFGTCGIVAVFILLSPTFGGAQSPASACNLLYPLSPSLLANPVVRRNLTGDWKKRMHLE